MNERPEVADNALLSESVRTLLIILYKLNEEYVKHLNFLYE